MLVSFLSFDDEMNKTSFQSKAIQNENEILFEDKSSKDTQIKITILEDSFILERFGTINMYLHFCLDKQTNGTYKNNDGLEFDFMVHTESLFIEKTKLKVRYHMLMNQEVISTFTFQVILFQD